MKARAEQALAAWTTEPQVDLGGGKGVAVQVAWNGAKLSQFVPLTRDKAAGVGLVVDDGEEPPWHYPDAAD